MKVIDYSHTPNTQYQLRIEDFNRSNAYIGTIPPGWYRTKIGNNYAYLCVSAKPGHATTVIGISAESTTLIAMSAHSHASWFEDSWERCPNQDPTLTF